jgi:putative DNA primase/helicase
MKAAGLAHALHAVRSGRQWKCKCVAHEDGSPSMIIFDGRTGVAQVRCLAGCDQRDLISALRSRGLWDCSRVDEPARAEIVSHETRMRARAARVFDDSMLCIGTLAQRYLERREIWSVARDLEDVRFHPHCPRERDVQPALVIAMRSLVSHAIVAVQRIFLTPEACKAGAMMLGPAGGAAMMLQPAGRELHITEGAESALSVMAMDQAPVWAMGSCGAIERLPVLEGVHRLVIWGDHDPIDPRTGRRPGHHAAEICQQRWLEAGRDVVTRIPRREGYDPADVWRDRCAR